MSIDPQMLVYHLRGLINQEINDARGAHEKRAKNDDWDHGKELEELFKEMQESTTQ